MLNLIISIIFFLILLISGQIYLQRKNKRNTKKEEGDTSATWTEYTNEGKITYHLKDNKVTKEKTKKRYKP